jgi:hypothetical protein
VHDVRNCRKSPQEIIPSKLTREWFNERRMLGVDLRLTGEKLGVGGLRIEHPGIYPEKLAYNLWIPV